MPDIPGFVHIPVPQIDQFADILIYIITGWGRMDELMDSASRIPAEHPSCAGVRGDKVGSYFIRRLAHFEQLSDAYFSTTPAMSRIVRQKCNKIRQIQIDRGLIAHGIYCVELGNPIKLRITNNKDNRDGTRTYTKEELGEVAKTLGNILTMFYSMAVDSFQADKENLENKWKIPHGQVDQLKTLLNHIQTRYIQTTLERYQRESESAANPQSAKQPRRSKSNQSKPLKT